MPKRSKPAPDPPVVPLEDREFAEAMKGVVPLVKDPRGRVRVSPPPVLRSRPTGAPSGSRVEQADSPPDDFAAHGVDRRREIRKLKRGDYPVQNELDLHGSTLQQALTEVGRFIENSRHAGLRCVCIVHGRGLNSAGGVSVLKGPVRACLMARREVLAYAVAPRSAGGTGAIYVLLRR